MKNFILIAGPCIIESEELCFEVAEKVQKITNNLGIDYVFKASYQKANRSRLDSFTGLDKKLALSILKKVGDHFKIPVITDVHESYECAEVAEYVDCLQIPAFLCRQTELLIAAGKTNKIVNIKKGQFLAPEAMEFAMQKVASTGNNKIWLTERGSTFGYESLIVDFTAIPRMQEFCETVIVDCTHSLQRPNQTIGVTGGAPDMIETISLASVATGANGLFLEVHPNPGKALSDSASMLQLDKLEGILEKCMKIRKVLN